jgi:glycine oxidase
MEYHSFIVGQGIAGSVLALTMQQKGHNVKIFDLPDENTSSRVAAGLCNPITGKRHALAWNALEFFHHSDRFYKESEKLLGIPIYKSLPIYRIFSSIAEQNNWSAKQNDERYLSFLENPQFTSLNTASYDNPLECLSIKGGGWLDIPAFLDATRSHFEEKGCYEVMRFQMQDVTDHQGEYVLGDDVSQNIIFCHGVPKNDLWSSLLLFPMKGEILTIHCPNAKSNAIISGGCFMLPLGNDLYRVGATYDWQSTELTITSEGRADIEKKLKTFLKLPYRVVKQDVGLRPAVDDRRPLIGAHPTLNNVYLLNGLGSKGVSSAPLLAKWLLNFVDHGIDVPKEVNLGRYT